MPDILSDDGRAIFEIVNFLCICTSICIFGMSANIINIVIFYKQGFQNTVNIGFVGLAISDLFCLMTLQWTCIAVNPLIALSNLHWSPHEVMYLTGGWPHGCFTSITSFITVYITAERYLSIAYPLKIKNMITRNTAIASVSLIFIVNLASLIPEYATIYLGWRWFPDKNQTLLGMMFRNSRSQVEGISYVLHSLFGIASFAGVIIFTALLVSKLKQSSKWRKDLTSSSDKGKVSNREKKTVKMVVLIASVLIACYIPGAFIALAAFVVGPEFNIGGAFTNICTAVWSIAVIFHGLNSSVNIFVYYLMSSKYKETFHKAILKQGVHPLDVVNSKTSL